MRIDATQRIGRACEEAGLDVFAIGEHHTSGYFSSSPPVLLGAVAAQTSTIALSTAVTMVTTSDPVRLAEDYSTVQHVAAGRVDIVLGRCGTVPPYGRSTNDTRAAQNLTYENYHLLQLLWREKEVDWDGQFRAPLMSFTANPRPLDDVPPFVWHGAARTIAAAEHAASYADGLFAATMLGRPHEVATVIDHYRSAYERNGHGRADQAIVGVGQLVFVAETSQDARRLFRPYFHASPVFDPDMSLEQAEADAHVIVGSPQEVTEKILANRDLYGDYQRQMFWIDHGGMSLDVVLGQLDLLGSQVVPTLRTEFAARRAPGVPTDPPSHADLVERRARMTAAGVTSR